MGLLKWNKQFALEQAAEDAELLQELLDIFKEAFTSDLNLMREGIAGEDCEKITSAAHSIKGAAASLGIDGVTEVAKSIEFAAKDGNLEIAREEIPTLELMLAEMQTL